MAQGDSQYDRLSEQVSQHEKSLKTERKRVEDLANNLKRAQSSLRRLESEFREHRQYQQAVTAGRREADRLTAEVEARLELIADVLASGVPPRAPGFDELLRHTEITPNDPGPLGMPEPAPREEDFTPAPPGWLRSRLGGARRYERRRETGQEQYQASVASHAEREAERIRKEREGRLKHEADVAGKLAADDAWNAEVERARTGFSARDPGAISWLVRQALAVSAYPEWYPCDLRRYEVTTRLDTHDILVELELPPTGVVPLARRYAYDEGADDPLALPRPRGEMALLYSGLIASIALRTASEVFAATVAAADTIDEVTIVARRRAIEAATGKESRLPLLILPVRREALAEVNLARVQPLACAAHLGADISLDPLTPTPARTPEPPAPAC
jgi:restriction system protein